MDIEQVKDMNKDLPDAENIDKVMDIKMDDFDKLKDEDKQYVKVQQAIMYVQSMNTIETSIFQIEEDIRHRILTTSDNIKIIGSRIADINESKINELSLDFIKNIFVIDGKEIPLRMPELNGFDDSIYKDDIEFYRLLVSYLKTYDKNLSDARTWLNKVKEKYISDIDEHTRELVSDFETLSDYIDNYFKNKLNSNDITDEQRKGIEEVLKWSEYGVTLEPVYNNLKEQFEEKGSLSSLFHNYRKNIKNIVEGAYKVCDNIGIRYPYRLIDDIESKIFTEQEYEAYKEYKFLLMFIVSRYIKYLGSSVKPNEKIFLNQMIANLVVLSRIEENHPSNKLLEKMKPNIKKILDFVIQFK